MGLFRRALAGDGTAVQYKTGDDCCGHARPVGFEVKADMGHVDDGIYSGIEESNERDSTKWREYWVVVKDGKIFSVEQADLDRYGRPLPPNETHGLEVYW